MALSQNTSTAKVSEDLTELAGMFAAAFLQSLAKVQAKSTGCRRRLG